MEMNMKKNVYVFIYVSLNNFAIQQKLLNL